MSHAATFSLDAPRSLAHRSFSDPVTRLLLWRELTTLVGVVVALVLAVVL